MKRPPRRYYFKWEGVSVYVANTACPVEECGAHPGSECWSSGGRPLPQPHRERVTVAMAKFFDWDSLFGAA